MLTMATVYKMTHLLTLTMIVGLIKANTSSPTATTLESFIRATAVNRYIEWSFAADKYTLGDTLTVMGLAEEKF